MKSSFISFFEGYDSDGCLVFNGNGAATVEGGFIDPGDFLQQHRAALLAVAQEKNARVVRVVIKTLMPLSLSATGN